MNIVPAALMAYLLGSIPFGLLLTRLAGVGDIRRIGSGSIGATNVLRTGNKGLAAVTLVFDVGKGVAAVLIGKLWGSEAALVASVAVVVGHMFPVWLRFRGGKGVATALGVLLALAWPVGVIAAAPVARDGADLALFLAVGAGRRGFRRRFSAGRWPVRRARSRCRSSRSWS